MDAEAFYFDGVVVALVWIERWPMFDAQLREIRVCQSIF